MDKYQYISYTHFIETYIIRISKLQFHHGVVLQFETKKNFDNFGCLYRRFHQWYTEFRSNQRFIIYVCCFGRENLKRELVMQIYISPIAINRGYLENGEGKGREGKAYNQGRWFEFSLHASGSFRECNRPVFFVPREPMVSRSTISTRPAIPGIRAHVYIPVPQIDKTLMEAI